MVGFWWFNCHLLHGLVDKLSSCCFVLDVAWRICGYFSHYLKAKTFWPSCSMKTSWQNFSQANIFNSFKLCLQYVWDQTLKQQKYTMNNRPDQINYTQQWFC